MTYGEKLKDPRWQKLRLEIFKRDNFTCQLCGDKESTLHVHHKEYRPGREPWSYPDSNFITYCVACHRVIEENKSIKDIRFVLASKHRFKSFEDFHNLIVTFYRGDKKKICFYQYSVSKDKLELIISLDEGMLDDVIDLFNRSFYKQ